MAKRARKTFQPQHHPFRMGRRRPLARCPRFSLRNYLMKDLSPPPASCDYSAKAGKALSQLYLNDKLGDCVIAGIGHVVGVLTAGAGNQFVYSDDQILQLYEAIGGYVPNHPNTDDGCDEQTALNYWQHHGAPSGTHKIAGWVAVNGADPNEYRTALWLFENLYFGLELPDKWVSPMPTRPGFTWDVAGPPNPDNGHCVVGAGYSNKGVKICTWGMLGTLTDEAVEKYATTAGSGELYTVISQDAINKATQKAPAGFDWSQLIADFDSMGGNLAPPATLRRRRA
ncbi:MAG TPA: hypothetical protein VN938_14545 [Xanthobacteraceae bacterium]|jgi:hypothetical protein|nr:hypothetical protein [Xanthobacteraceae bacterium]